MCNYWLWGLLLRWEREEVAHCWEEAVEVVRAGKVSRPSWADSGMPPKQQFGPSFLFPQRPRCKRGLGCPLWRRVIMGPAAPWCDVPRGGMCQRVSFLLPPQCWLVTLHLPLCLLRAHWTSHWADLSHWKWKKISIFLLCSFYDTLHGPFAHHGVWQTPKPAKGKQRCAPKQVWGGQENRTFACWGGRLFSQVNLKNYAVGCEHCRTSERAQSRLGELGTDSGRRPSTLRPLSHVLFLRNLGSKFFLLCWYQFRLRLNVALLRCLDNAFVTELPT